MGMSREQKTSVVKYVAYPAAVVFGLSLVMAAVLGFGFGALLLVFGYLVWRFYFLPAGIVAVGAFVVAQLYYLDPEPDDWATIITWWKRISAPACGVVILADFFA